MAAVQSADARASFLFVGDLNDYYRNGWVLPPRTVMVLRPSILPLCQLGCDQLVIGPTHARGGTLYLLMTYVPDLVRVAVVAPLGSSDRSSLSIAISVAQAIPNLCVSRRVLLKHQLIGLQTVMQ